MTYRFVVCLDVEADSLEEAYSELYTSMGKVDRSSFQWESTDEAFDPDGNPVTPEEVQEARMSTFARLNPRGLKRNNQ